MKIPTILQINVVANSGSTGRICEEIGVKIQQQGWNSYVVYGRNANASSSKLIKMSDWPDIMFHVLLTRLFDKHGLGSVRATRRLIRKIQSIQPDLIHLHNLHGYYINYKLLFDYLHSVNLPVLWTLHDCWPFTGHCTHYDAIGCRKWETGCEKCPRKREYPASVFLDASRQNYHRKAHLFNSLPDLTLVTVSEWLKKQVEKSFLREKPVEVVYNGIDTQVYYPRVTLGLRKNKNLIGKFILMGVANVWDGTKGLEQFLSLSQYLDEDMLILLIGLNKKQLKFLPNNIWGMDRTESMNKLAEYYSMADVFINFSLEESFGMVTAEAMACGTPVIVMNSTACPEVVTENTGIVLTDRKPSTVLKAIKKVKELGKETYTEKCVARVKKHFNANTIYAQYSKIYSDRINTSC